MLPMGLPPVPHPDYLITLVGPGSGAGAGVPGAAVRDAGSGRVIDRLPGRMDMYSAVAGTAGNRVFFLAACSDWERLVGHDPEISQLPPGGAFRVRIDDSGRVTDLSAVPGIGPSGPADLAATADGSKLAFPARRRFGPPARTPDGPPCEISIVLVATGERTVWQAESDGSISDLSFSADGRRLAYSWHGAGEGNGIRVTDLPGTAAGGVVTTPSRLAVPEQNSLGNLGQAVISPDGSTLYVTAARYGPGGQPVTRLAEISVADGQLLRIAYERQGADPANVIFGWGPLAIDPSGQHALIACSGNLARIELGTGQFTGLPMDENGAFDIAW
jgi:DNA-binding beta-propeller fold protein YncE